MNDSLLLIMSFINNVYCLLLILSSVYLCQITGSLFQYVLQVWLSHLSSLSQLVALGQFDKVSESLSLACICLKSQ